MRFTDHVRAVQTAPALAPSAIAFFDRRNGLLVTTGGGRDIPKVGWERPSEPARIERTADGGVTWHAVWSDRGVVLGELQLAPTVARGLSSPTVGGYGPTPTRTVSFVSGDGGRTWRGGRRPVTSPLRGRAGRTVYKATAARIRRSDDGGRTWRTVADHKWVPIAQLGVVDATHVWAVSHVNSQGFDFYDVHVTDDGGRHWTRRRVPSLPSAFASHGRAWAVDGATAAVWRTLDDGRTWRIITSARAIGVRSVDVARTGELDVATDVGELRSLDGGRTWRSVDRPSGRTAAALDGRVAFVPPENGYSEHVLVRHGRGWIALNALPGLFTAGDAQFTDERHGLVAAGNEGDVRARIYRTRDGGQSWTRVGAPAGVSPDDAAALGPDTVVVEQERRLSITTDDGGHWQDVRIPLRFPECIVQRPGKTTWILCSDVIVGHGGPGAVLLRSSGGHMWSVRTANRPFAASFLATSDTEAWTPGWTGDPGSIAPLWHTTDGGASWQRVAAAPPPDAPVVYRLPLPPR